MFVIIVLLFFDYQRYKSEGHDTVILAGAEYGSGSSRDWAAKGPMLLVHSLAASYFIQFLDFLRAVIVNL